MSGLFEHIRNEKWQVETECDNKHVDPFTIRYIRLLGGRRVSDHKFNHKHAEEAASLHNESIDKILETLKGYDIHEHSES